MAVLHNSRHEQFAQLVASGRTPAEAYVEVGYAVKAAYTCGPRLFKNATVQARVSELLQVVSAATVTRMSLDRQFVLRELMDNALKAKQSCEWAASNRALELLGKELGMFNPRDLPWDGNPATLTDSQLEQLQKYLERLAFGGDEAQLQAARERAMLEAGLVVEIEPGPTDQEW